MQLVRSPSIVAVAFTPSEAAEVASSNSLAASIQDKARAMKGTRASPTWGGAGSYWCGPDAGEWCENVSKTGGDCCCPGFQCS
jgi:hypothetical protein